MMRLRSRPEGVDPDDPHPFDDVFRRMAQAHDRHDRAVEAEEYQAVGMQLRECLLSLVGAMRRRLDFPGLQERPQDSNFIAWSDALWNRMCGGERNQALRSYLKSCSEKTWQLVNWLTHDRNANDAAASIAMHACDTLVGHSAQMIMREKTDNLRKCPRCSSRNIRSHFDVTIPPDGDYYTTCGACGWSSHPDTESE
jgi:hypothetical protein